MALPTHFCKAGFSGCNCSRQKQVSHHSRVVVKACQVQERSKACRAQGQHQSYQQQQQPDHQARLSRAHLAVLGLAGAAWTLTGVSSPSAAADAATPAGDAAAAAAAAVAGVTPVDPSTYVPGPVEVGWQIWFAAIVSTIPFVIGAYEFGKRILIQRRCQVCGGRGLVMRGSFPKKCPQCGGFFPWISWRMFLSANARPGNGGPLLQPRGQTSVFYTVPSPPGKSQEDSEQQQQHPVADDFQLPSLEKQTTSAEQLASSSTAKGDNEQ